MGRRLDQSPAVSRLIGGELERLRHPTEAIHHRSGMHVLVGIDPNDELDLICQH